MLYSDNGNGTFDPDKDYVVSDLSGNNITMQFLVSVDAPDPRDTEVRF